MARRIVWSKRAQLDRKAIFSYWNKRNKSNYYSKKLNQLFIDATELIAIHPLIGKKTNKKNVQIKFIRQFAILYEIKEKELLILTIFDTRQDPSKLNY